MFFLNVPMEFIPPQHYVATYVLLTASSSWIYVTGTATLNSVRSPPFIPNPSCVRGEKNVDSAATACFPPTPQTEK